MIRSFSNRIFSGVCGGLGAITPLDSWAWRMIFVLLTLVTQGTGILVYLLWWWLLPLDSPLRRSNGTGFRTLIATVLTVALIAGYFLQGNLFPAEYFLPSACLILAIVFFVKQIASGSQANIALGLVVVIVPIITFLNTLQVLPAGLSDLIFRAYPSLLVFIGLWVLLRYRVTLSGFIALALTVVLAFGVASLAFNSRIGEQRTDNQVTIAIPDLATHNLAQISAEVTTLQINIDTLDTDVQVSSAEPDSRLITGVFTGSNNSQLNLDYQEDGTIATFTLQEEQAQDFPRLEDIGRATLRLNIPRDIAVAVAFRGERGETFNFDLAQVNLERLNLEVLEGNALVVLPDYQPLSPSVQQSPGVWRVLGNLDVVVPETVGVRFLLDRNSNREPRAGSTHDDLIYRVELDGNDYVLVARRYDALTTQITVRLDVLGGNLRVVTQGAEN